jgi:hypothetical protein
MHKRCDSTGMPSTGKIVHNDCHADCLLTTIYVKKIIADGFKIYFWPAKNFINRRFFGFSSFGACMQICVTTKMKITAMRAKYIQNT